MRRSSIIWKLSANDFRQLISDSNTYKEALRELGLEYQTGGNYKTLKKRIQEEKVDVSHIEKNKKTFRGGFTRKKVPLSELLVKGLECQTTRLKQRLVKDGILEDRCSKCGTCNIWQGEPLALQLDHIDGNHTNNTLENLRIMCPNCHTQTTTFSGRNRRKYLEASFCECGAKKCPVSSTCKRCRKVNTKISWPSKEELKILLWEKATTQIAKELGVSDTAVSHYAKKLGLSKPPRGYWQIKSA